MIKKMNTNVVFDCNKIVDLALGKSDKSEIATIMIEVADGIWLTDFNVVCYSSMLNEQLILDSEFYIEEPDSLRINDNLSGHIFMGMLKGVFIEYWKINYQDTVQVILNRLNQGKRPVTKTENKVTKKVEEFLSDDSGSVTIPATEVQKEMNEAVHQATQEMSKDIQNEEPIFDAIKEAEEKQSEEPKPCPLSSFDNFMNSIPNSPDELKKIQDKQKQMAESPKQPEPIKSEPESIQPEPEPIVEEEPVQEIPEEVEQQISEPDISMNDDSGIDFSLPSFDMDGGDDIPF